MEKIIWNDSYCTGIAIIDSQHKSIVDQINNLIDNLDSEDKSHLSLEIIKLLDRYSAEHFATEEKYMKNSDYPNIEAHIKQHHAFKMNAVKSAIKLVKGVETVPEETILYLRNWWSNHILKTDMEYKNYLKNI